VVYFQYFTQIKNCNSLIPGILALTIFFFNLI